jgi:hypothetical protein
VIKQPPRPRLSSRGQCLAGEGHDCPEKQVDMGVAVATDEGLLVPVVRHAEGQS